MSSPSATDLLQEALALHRSGAVAEAATRYAEVLRAEPDNADAHYYLGMMSCQEGRFAEGAGFARKSLAADPQHVRAHVLLGRALSALGDEEEAIATFERAIALEPRLAQAHSHLADLLSDLHRYPEAVERYERALLLAPGAADDWLNRGLALRSLGRLEDAAASFERAIAVKPDFAQAHLERANVLWDLRRFSEALEGVDRALTIEPRLAEAWHTRGVILNELKRYDEALAAYDKALALKSDLAEAWLGRGNALRELKKYDDGFAAYDRALALKADLPAAWLGCGNTLFELKRYEDACAAYGRALALRPDASHVACARLDVKLLMCDWANLDVEFSNLVAVTKRRRLHASGATPVPDHGVAKVSKSTSPMIMARLTDDADIILASAIECVEEHATCPRPFIERRLAPAGKLRLGYLSQDFRLHVTGMNFVELFERHDRRRFELFGFALCPGDGSDVRKRIEKSFDQFHDLSTLDDETAAQRIRDLQIDVLVEIVPLSQGSRPAILAYRPAPVQINGWSAGCSRGASYVDYILGDPWILPFAYQSFFVEKIVHLPHTCFPYDSRRAVSTHMPSREEEGLPASGFVFCCFNNSYKITPEFFTVWMSLLREVQGSVLWLARNNDLATANLRREAVERGIDPGRLVFAEKKPALADHLARHRLADLFLDTLPYNAQSTAMDALWTGLPVLTCAGRSYAGRFAMSQLHNIGLAELVAEDLAGYEALALALARDPGRLNGLKARLAINRLTMPLFDTARLCRELEAAYATMADICRRGESPRSFAVDPL